MRPTNRKELEKEALNLVYGTQSDIDLDEWTLTFQQVQHQGSDKAH